MSELAGRRIVVSGASSGIGAAVATRCARAGARVALLGRRAEALEALGAGLAGSVVLPVDVTDHQASALAVDSAAEHLGGIDGLVNVAGINRAGPFADGDPAHWQEMLTTNVLATMVMTQHVLPHLRQAGGDVVTIGSAAASGDRSGTSAVYAATKAAVEVWSASLDAELAPLGVRVITISPGTVRTDFARATPDEELRRQRAERFARLGLDPDVVAAQVVHVMSQPRSVLVSHVTITPLPQRSDA